MATDTLTPLVVKTKTAGDVIVKIVDTLGTNQLAIDASGRIAVTQASGPWTQNLTQVNGTALGSPTAAGTSAAGNILAVQGVTGGVAQNVTVSTALPAGANTIGGVNIATALPSGGNTIGNVGLIAGSAIVGKVGIDQTTPGTTNGVQITGPGTTAGNPLYYNFATGAVGTSSGSPQFTQLTAGSAIVGKLGIDQTTPGTTNGVQITGPGTSSGNPIYVNTGAGTTGTMKTSNQVASATAVAVGGSATLAAGFVTSTKVGTLQQITTTASAPMKWDIQTVNGTGVATTVFSLFTSGAFLIGNWLANVGTEVSTIAGDGTHVQFQVVATNNDNTNAVTAYATFWWLEN